MMTIRCQCRGPVECPSCFSVCYPGSPMVAHPVVSTILFRQGSSLKLQDHDYITLVEEHVTCASCLRSFLHRHDRRCVERALVAARVHPEHREGFILKVFGSHGPKPHPR